MDNVKWIETARANPIRRAVEGGGWEEVGDWRSGEERRQANSTYRRRCRTGGAAGNLCEDPRKGERRAKK